MMKPKIATDWLAACAGCHMSLLDIDEKLIELLQKVELTSSPLTDLKVPPESGVDVGLLTGAVNNDDNLHVARRMRQRSRILVACGDCAVFGGIIRMRNHWPLSEALEAAYRDNPSTVEGLIPGAPEIMRPLPDRSVGEVVKVDVYVPGCPPSPEVIFYVLNELAEGRIPALDESRLNYD
ncbi:MAG: NADP oxidoreductase [Anaerolineae bacterium]|nr:NADP oxidoreductase [Anaerolineae bacterium]